MWTTTRERSRKQDPTWMRRWPIGGWRSATVVAVGRCCCGTLRRRVIIVRRGRGPAPTTGRWITTIGIRGVRIRVPRVLRARRGSRWRLGHGGCRCLCFFLCLSLNLGQDGTRIHTASVEMALERQKVFSVMLLEGVSSGRGCADAQLRRDVLPRLVLRCL